MLYQQYITNVRDSDAFNIAQYFFKFCNLPCLQKILRILEQSIVYKGYNGISKLSNAFQGEPDKNY